MQINTAFLDISFEEYSSYTEVPSLSYLESKILDKNPFTELCDWIKGSILKILKQ
ncbi:MAG: hypothetical protein R2777_06005 [Chitinophagales bacterium]